MARTPLPVSESKAVTAGTLIAPIAGPGDHGAGDGVFAVGFGGGNQREQYVLAEPSR